MLPVVITLPRAVFKSKTLLALTCLALASCQHTNDPPSATTRTPVQPVMNIASQFNGKTVTGSLQYRYLDSEVLEFGNQFAPSIVSIFTNYNCTICNEWLLKHWAELESRVSQNEIVVRIVPVHLESIDHSMHISKTTSCVSRMGSGVLLHQKLLHTNAITPESLRLDALNTGVTAEALDTCLADERITKAVARRQAAVQLLGINALPTISIGNKKAVGPINKEELELLLK